MPKNIKRIAVAAEDDCGLNLNSEVSSHFGRCPFYLIANIKENSISEFYVVPNPHYERHQPGMVPYFIKNIGADIIIAGGMGPRAINMFQNFDIEVSTGAVGQIGKVIEAYLEGQIRGIVPCAHDHPESCGAPNDNLGGCHG